MNDIDTFYFIRQFGDEAISIGIAGRVLAAVRDRLPDGCDKALIRTLSVCHVRRTEFVANSGCEVMFNADENGRRPLDTVPGGYARHMKSIALPVFRMESGLDDAAFRAAADDVTDACLLYINAIVRHDIANGRRQTEITAPLRNRIERILETEYPAAADAVESGHVHVRTIMNAVLEATADCMDLGMVSEETWAAEIRAAVENG